MKSRDKYHKIGDTSVDKKSELHQRKATKETTAQQLSTEKKTLVMATR